MPQNRHRLLNFYASKSWAILPETLEEMRRIYVANLERRQSGEELDLEALAAKMGRPLDNTRTGKQRENGAAIIPVSGPIFRYANLFTEMSGATSIEILATDFQQALSDPSIERIIFDINSPGGEVDGTSEMAQHIVAARGLKPITAYASHLCASAAYWLASACDEIVCADTASLGSIGVACRVRLSKDNQSMDVISSQSPNKRLDPSTETGLMKIKAHVDSLAKVFIETVAKNRGMTPESVIEKGQGGSLLVGQDAVDAGLADRVGTLECIIAGTSSSSSQKLVAKSTNSGVESRTNPETKEGVNLMAEETDKTSATDKQSPVTDPPAKQADASEVEKLQALLAEAQQRETATAAKLSEVESDKAKLGEQVGKLETSVGALQRQARETRFKEMSKGWIGDPRHHVAMLENLSASEGGEESALFKGYVTQQKAAAEQVETSELLKEIGSSQAAEGSAEAEIEARAIKMSSESNGKMTRQQAYDQIYASDPALRARVDEESRRATN
jgi:ClpP class serine protease